MPRILGFLVAAWAVGMALPAQAQQAVLSQLYGQGVHEFYGGDYQAAKRSLTEAAANDSRDPRVYYYRALANLRLGDESAAKSDFDTAAALEYTPAGRQFAVSRSLQRVQQEQEHHATGSQHGGQ